MRSRGFPIKIEVKQAALRRFVLPDGMRMKIEAEIANDFTGYNGEKMLDYHLRVFTGPDIRIYNDLRLNDGNPFQLDTLIVTPFFLLPIDAKNFDGETTIDFNQTIQKNSYGNQKRVSSPLAQTRRHCLLLMEWFQKRNFHSIPIEGLIVNSNPVGILKTDPNSPEITEKIANAEMVPRRIAELQNKYTHRFLSSNDLNKIHKLLMDAHTPLMPNIEKAYGIDKNKISKGVCCPKCNCFGMERKNRFWLCPICGEKSTTAHKQAIRDYFLLIKPTITVSECCDFLCIESRYVAKRLLQSMNLPYIGDKKARIYFCPWYNAKK